MGIKRDPKTGLWEAWYNKRDHKTGKFINTRRKNIKSEKQAKKNSYFFSYRNK